MKIVRYFRMTLADSLNYKMKKKTDETAEFITYNASNSYVFNSYPAGGKFTEGEGYYSAFKKSLEITGSSS